MLKELRASDKCFTQTQPHPRHSVTDTFATQQGKCRAKLFKIGSIVQKPLLAPRSLAVAARAQTLQEPWPTTAVGSIGHVRLS